MRTAFFLEGEGIYFNYPKWSAFQISQGVPAACFGEAAAGMK